LVTTFSRRLLTSTVRTCSLPELIHTGRQGISGRFLSFLGNIDKKAGEKLVGENQTVSARALETANTLVSKTREADQQHGVSSRFHNYYSKALSTPMGQKYVSSSSSEITHKSTTSTTATSSSYSSTFTVLTSRVAQFYHEGAQTAVDIHEEAKRIAVSSYGRW
jgi:hypothetical protein